MSLKEKLNPHPGRPIWKNHMANTIQWFCFQYVLLCSTKNIRKNDDQNTFDVSIHSVLHFYGYVGFCAKKQALTSFLFVSSEIITI